MACRAACSRTCATARRWPASRHSAAIVIDGALTKNGMVSFKAALSPQDAEASRLCGRAGARGDAAAGCGRAWELRKGEGRGPAPPGEDFGWRCAVRRPIECAPSSCGAVAQLGERRVRNAKVEGSIPFRSTIFYPADIAAPVVERIQQPPPKGQVWVQFPAGVPAPGDAGALPTQACWTACARRRALHLASHRARPPVGRQTKTRTTAMKPLRILRAALAGRRHLR